MYKKTIFIVLLISIAVCVDCKKLSRGRSSSSRGSSRKVPQPAPTSFSRSQQAQASQQSFSGWQSKPAPKPTNTQSHSYPSSQTGLSGGGNQQKTASQNSQGSHSYPVSNGMSGNAGQKSGYPAGSGLSGSGSPGHQGGGLSGTGSGYPAQHGSGAGYPAHGSGLSGAAAPPPYSSVNNKPLNNAGNNYGSNQHPPPPPPYSSNVGTHYGGAGQYGQGGYGSGYGGHNSGYGGYGGPGHGGPGYGGPGYGGPGYRSQMSGYFGGNNGGNYGSVGRSSGVLRGVGIAGAGIGTVLTGLALWNLARSTGQRHHTVIYDNRGQPVAVAPGNETNAATDSMLADLVNCTLTISSSNSTEVLAIPCAIATSFSPEADVKDVNGNSNKEDSTKCTITVVTKTGQEYMTTIPCSILLNTAAENNVTEPAVIDDAGLNGNVTSNMQQGSAPVPIPMNTGAVPTPDLNCISIPEEIKDPRKPCIVLSGDLSVIPLNSSSTTTTPASA